MSRYPNHVVKPDGRCPACRYKRSSLNHHVLCVRGVTPTRHPAEIARLAALSRWGDTPAEQWERRRAIWEAAR